MANPQQRHTVRHVSEILSGQNVQHSVLYLKVAAVNGAKQRILCSSVYGTDKGVVVLGQGETAPSYFAKLIGDCAAGSQPPFALFTSNRDWILNTGPEKVAMAVLRLHDGDDARIQPLNRLPNQSHGELRSLFIGDVNTLGTNTTPIINVVADVKKMSDTSMIMRTGGSLAMVIITNGKYSDIAQSDQCRVILCGLKRANSRSAHLKFTLWFDAQQAHVFDAPDDHPLVAVMPRPSPQSSRWELTCRVDAVQFKEFNEHLKQGGTFETLSNQALVTINGSLNFIRSKDIKKGTEKRVVEMRVVTATQLVVVTVWDPAQALPVSTPEGTQVTITDLTKGSIYNHQCQFNSTSTTSCTIAGATSGSQTGAAAQPDAPELELLHEDANDNDVATNNAPVQAANPVNATDNVVATNNAPVRAANPVNANVPATVNSTTTTHAGAQAPNDFQLQMLAMMQHLMQTVAPAQGVQAPAPGVQAPLPGAVAPLPGVQAPLPSVQVPVQAPLPGAVAPLPGVQAPLPSVDAPLPGVQVPVQAPLPGADAPLPGVQAPLPRVDAPLPGVQVPEFGADAPLPGVEMPLEFDMMNAAPSLEEQPPALHEFDSAPEAVSLGPTASEDTNPIPSQSHSKAASLSKGDDSDELVNKTARVE